MSSEAALVRETGELVRDRLLAHQLVERDVLDRGGDLADQVHEDVSLAARELLALTRDGHHPDVFRVLPEAADRRRQRVNPIPVPGDEPALTQRVALRRRDQVRDRRGGRSGVRLRPLHPA